MYHRTFFFIIWLALAPFCLCASEPALTVAELIAKAQSYEGKRVCVKGFLYENAEHKWILADLPNLHSCCLKAGKAKRAQLRVCGHPLPPLAFGSAVTLEGKLSAKKTAPFFSLEEAVLASTPSSERGLVLFLFAALFIFTIVLLTKYRMSRRYLSKRNLTERLP